MQVEAGNASESAVMGDDTLRVGRIQRFCLQDGPGIRTTVFLQGCPIRCWWCHNPDLRTGDSSAGVAWPIPRLLEAVTRDVRYWRQSGGGVTLSGGEPLAQAGALRRFLRCLGEAGHDRCVQTSGAVPRHCVEHVADHVDRWLFDLKALEPERFMRGVGGDASLPPANLRWLLSSRSTPVTVRVPLIRGFNAGTDEPRRMGELLESMPRRVTVEILPGHRVGCDGDALRDDPCPSPEELAAAENMIRRAGVEAFVRW